MNYNQESRSFYTFSVLKYEKLMQDTRALDESGDSISLDFQEEEIPPTLISSSIVSHVPSVSQCVLSVRRETFSISDIFLSWNV